MSRRHAFLAVLTVFVVACTGYVGFMAFRPAGLPFDVRVTDAHTAVIVPVAGRPLPPALHAGDRIDLGALRLPARIAVSIMHLSSYSFPRGQTYAFVIERSGSLVTVPVTTVDLGTSRGPRWFEWTTLGFTTLLGAIALITLWRGHDRAAAGMAFWAVAFLVGLAFQHAQLTGLAALGAWLTASALYLLARCGFYLMVEAMVEHALTPRTRALWRGAFLLLLAAGALSRLGGPVLFAASGRADLLRYPDGLLFSASYLVPLGLLFAGYGHASATQRLRLRWMLWSSVVFVMNIFLNNTAVLGRPYSYMVSNSVLVLSLFGFVYAVLRHRVVDVSFVLNRALVYAATTSLVMGLFALVESVVERSTLSRDASLLLELAVPLGLGIALSTVHKRVDSVVERLFFRRQYLATRALGDFARDCAFITRRDNLLDQAVDQVMTHTAADGLAVYEATPAGYVRVRQQGVIAFPDHVEMDDSAFVRLRSQSSELALHEIRSGLGPEGYVFPMTVRGTLLGAFVLGPRPDERYAPDERELLFRVVHEVGAALLALRARENELLVDRLASGLLSPHRARDQARQLVAAGQAV